MEKINIKHDIKYLEIDLIDACNLSCPLCNRNRHISKDGYLPLADWKAIIDSYDLDIIFFLGTRSEHTLYPHFLELVEFIKSRDIDIILSTNGDTHNPLWWQKLSKLLTTNDEVRFAVDGSTQDIYEMYRVGGSLANVLLNHQAFKTQNHNDVVQYINFEHNRCDYTENLFSLFSATRIINSSFATGTIRPTDEYIKKYKILNLYIKMIKEPQIVCETKGEQHFINYKGEVSPCCHYNENLVLNGTQWDGTYEDIENAKHDFCTQICDKTCVKFRKDLNIEL